MPRSAHVLLNVTKHHPTSGTLRAAACHPPQTCLATPSRHHPPCLLAAPHHGARSHPHYPTWQSDAGVLPYRHVQMLATGSRAGRQARAGTLCCPPPPRRLQQAPPSAVHRCSSRGWAPAAAAGQPAAASRGGAGDGGRRRPSAAARARWASCPPLPHAMPLLGARQDLLRYPDQCLSADLGVVRLRGGQAPHLIRGQSQRAGARRGRGPSVSSGRDWVSPASDQQQHDGGFRPAVALPLHEGSHTPAPQNLQCTREDGQADRRVLQRGHRGAPCACSLLAAQANAPNAGQHAPRAPSALPAARTSHGRPGAACQQTSVIPALATDTAKPRTPRYSPPPFPAS